MKKIFPVLILSLICSTILTAQVTSINAVGMVSLTLPKGQLSIMHNPFLSDGTLTVADIFGTDNLPNGTKVYFWSSDQSYIIESFSRGAWVPGTTNISRVESMFVSIPDSATEAFYTVTVSGEVPDASRALTSLVTLSPGLTLTAFPYPVEIGITEAGIPAENGDKVYFWDGSSWVIESFSRGAWVPGTSTFQPGVGFYYVSASLANKSWTASKPYDWP